jgi:deoxyribodipyrimidine photo-lyase
VVNERGGSSAARAALRQFVELRLSRYGTERSEPTSDASSGLSPWIHFGHLSVHEILQAVARREGWSADSVSDKASGKREGWWNMSPSAESFLDELITWRELGYQFAHKRPDHDRYESLPEWARATLEEHARDPREFTYSLEQFEGAKTHDALWNAAQRQLLREGRMHNYLRMLWGKKILEWTASPREALAVMIELNNKYALDGRDPNSYSGIFWVLGRFDRPWAPKRKIFGSIRYMSSTNTAKKFEVRPYLAKYAPLTSAR